MNKKNLLCSFFLLCCFSLNMSQVSAVCVSAFLNKKKIEKIWDGSVATVLFFKTKLLIPSKLAVPDAMQIISNVDYPGNPSMFIGTYIKRKRVLEVASGGFTDLVVFLREQGAGRILSTDFVKLKSKGNDSVYLKGDIKEPDTVIEIVSRLGGRADTTIITSVFGGINKKEAQKWFIQLRELTRPGGVILLDFLLYDQGPSRKMTQEEFETLLKQLEDDRIIEDWISAKNTINVPYEYQTVGNTRPLSLTYKIILPKSD